MTIEISLPAAVSVVVSNDVLGVELSDGRRVEVPLEWYPRLQHASCAELQRWRLIGRGQGIRWDDLDEDISVQGLLAGNRSGESGKSFSRWLAGRAGRPDA